MNCVRLVIVVMVSCILIMAMAACSPGIESDTSKDSRQERVSETAELTLPELERAADQGKQIRIVTTTGIIGDVASTIAGDSAEVIALMAPNQDPHAYQSTADDLQQVASADAVLVNGWQLEEGLIQDLENAAGDVPLVPVSAGLEPRFFLEAAPGEEAQRVDPHVWLSPLNVLQWVDNIEYVLSTLDPKNSEAYAQRAEQYRALLRDLDAYIREQIETVNGSQRVLVTNHDAFGYFADTYQFTIIGTIIPGDSSLAEPASRDLAALVERMRESSVCAIFVEHSASQRLASQLADDLDHCDEIQIVSLYSGALGEKGSGAETYLTMMKRNTDMIVNALKSANKPFDAG